MSFAQLKNAFKSRFMSDSTSTKENSPPPPNKSLRSSATCPNFSCGDDPSSSLPSVSTSSTSAATHKSSTSSCDWGRREHLFKLAFLSEHNSY